MANTRVVSSFVLMGCAIALMLPSLFLPGLSSVSREDWDVARAPVAIVPLDSLQEVRSAAVVFHVPANDQWTRIRQRWGDPGYVVFAEAADRAQTVLSWSGLGLQVTGSSGAGPFELTSSRLTLMRAAANDTGLIFRPKPGQRVRLDIVVSAGVSLPAGHVIVAPNWNTANGEERAGGMALALNLRPYVRLAFLTGVSLFVVAVVIGNWRTA